MTVDTLLERAVHEAERALADTRSLWQTGLRVGHAHPDSIRFDTALNYIAEADNALSAALRALKTADDSDTRSKEN